MKKVAFLLKEFHLKLNKMINVIFCGYRTWALNVFNCFTLSNTVNVLKIIQNQEEFLENEIEFRDQSIDLIIFIGWSWIIPKEITEKYLCLGIHPSDLPNYRGGSPIQNQIIDGVNNSKVSLMTLSSSKIDAGDIWMKEDLDLGGSTIEKIFEHITESSIKLLETFFFQYPNISPENQDLSKGTYFKRRKPEESRITIEDFKNKSLQDIYNFIRCLTDPYPNAYIEDEGGNRLYFKEVKYVPAEIESN